MQSEYQSNGSWVDRYHTPILVLTLAVVVGGMASVYLRTRFGSGPSTEMGWDSVFVLLIAGTPSLVAVVATRRWVISPWQCLMAILAWGLFLTGAGDLSCVDCGFALLIPFSMAAPQAILLILALFLPDLRQSRVSDD